MSTTTEQVEVAKLLAWSEPKPVDTKAGKRLLSTAPADEKFWTLWRAGKEQLKAAGVSCGKDNSGQWQACWWRPVPVGEVEAVAKAAEESRAVEAVFDVPAPAGLAYLPYQLAGVRFLAGRSGSLLADEMGLGKTVQAIGLVNADPAVRKVLVVCPNSVKLNWRNELNKWLTRPLAVMVQYAGTDWVGGDCDVVVLNYELLSKFPELFAQEWDLLVADEAHFAKNPKAQRTKLLLGGGKKKDGKREFPGVAARRRVFMTGTPVLNKPIELFPILESLQPGKWTFKDKVKFCAGFRGRWGWDFSGNAHADEFQLRLRSEVMCRRLKREVLKDLPPKRRQIIEVAANGASGLVARQNELYSRHASGIDRAEVDAVVAELADDAQGYADASSRLKKAQQAAFEEMAKVCHEIALAKVPYVIEHVQNALESTRKVVVFAHHLDVHAAIAEAFGPACLLITGETPPDSRQPIVTQFNEDPSKTVLLLSIKAAGVGLSVRASLEVFAELDWVPGVMAQAEDRCHGYGRGIEGEPLLVQHIVLEGSVDASKVKALVRKQDVADRVLDVGMAAPKAQAALPETVTVDVPVHQEPAAALVVRKPGQPAEDTRPVPVSEELRELVHGGLRQLAGCDDDRAAVRNGVGFSKVDGLFGHSLAERSRLTDKMVPYAARLCRKYQKQLGAAFLARLEELS